MAESSRRYNLRDTRKKPQGELLKKWEVEYSKVISNENRCIPLEKAKTAIRSAFENGMFEQWRITLKCPLSGQRIRVPARYADCTHIECFDLEAFLRMKTQKNLRVCPICQKEVEKPLANLRIDEYIETVLSTLPDAMQVELLPDGTFTEVFEEFVEVTNVINDEEPFVQDNNAPAFAIKQEALEDDDEYITLSDSKEDSMEEIVEMKPISFMPLNIDIKPKIQARQSSDSSGNENDESRTMINENDQHQKPTTSTEDALDFPSGPALKMKITTIGIDIIYGTASFQTSNGKYYPNRPLHKYRPILCESEADVLGCEAHIIFRSRLGGIWDISELRVQSVFAYRKKFQEFSEDVHSISHLWENGRITVDLYNYSDNVKAFLPIYDVCNGLFGQERCILKCKVLEINWISDSWPFSVITNVVHHCKQLILKIKQALLQKLHKKLLCLLYETTLPQHIDITLEFNEEPYDFISELEKRFQGSTAQYLKFKLLSAGFSRNKLLRNYYGTLEMKIVASRRDHSGLRVVIIEQRPHKSVFHQESIDAAPKLKISKIKIDICYGTASFQTPEGQEYGDLLLSSYVSIFF